MKSSITNEELCYFIRYGIDKEEDDEIGEEDDE